MSNYIPKLSKQSKNASSPYVKAKNLLSASVVDSLIGREEEYSHLYSKIKNALESQVSLTFYVSGPAGTGKSLTVTNIANELKNDYSFKFININCMSFQNAASFYEKILSNFQVKSKRLCRRTKSESLSDMYKIKDAFSEMDEMTILLLDEIDQLKSKNHEILNNIFKLPSILKNKIILIGIANALDFTSKMIWLKDLERVNFYECRFLPYNKDQIVKIIEHRLKISQNENILIDKFAIEYCARKIASCSGDIRKALDVCRRAIELVEINLRNHSDNSNKTTPLKSIDYQRNMQIDKVDPIKHVDIKLMITALNKVYGTAVDKIDNDSKIFLPSDQQVVLCTLLILIKSKSLHEVKLSECRQVLTKICSKRGISTDGKSESDILNMCQLLADYGYVSIKNENVIALGRSPFAKARTPKKNNSIYLSLQIDPDEAEQLLSSFHKTIILNANIYLN